MNDQVVSRLLDGLSPRIPGEEEALLRRFAAFMDHHEVWLTGHALRGGKLRLTFANDAGTYVVGLPEIRALTAVQDRGEPFPWEALARLEPEEDGPPEPPRRVGSSSARR